MLLKAINFKSCNFCTGGNYFPLQVAAADDIGKTLYQNRLARYLHAYITFSGVRADGFAQRSAIIFPKVSRELGASEEMLLKPELRSPLIKMYASFFPSIEKQILPHPSPSSGVTA